MSCSSGTCVPARRSAPAARRPHHRRLPASTRRGPAPTAARTAGSTPTAPGAMPRSPPRPPCPPPGARAARPGAGTTWPAGPRPGQGLPRRGRRQWPPRRAAWQTDQATRLPGAMILADHRVMPGPRCYVTAPRRAYPISRHSARQPQDSRDQRSSPIARSLTVITKFAAEPPDLPAGGHEEDLMAITERDRIR